MVYQRPLTCASSSLQQDRGAVWTMKSISQSQDSRPRQFAWEECLRSQHILQLQVNRGKFILQTGKSLIQSNEPKPKPEILMFPVQGEPRFPVLYFQKYPVHERIIPYHLQYKHLQPYILLPPWASGITTISLTYYYPHGLQVLPPLGLQTTTPSGFRYYHLQPYNPSKLLFISIFYIRVVKHLFNCGRMKVFRRVRHDHFICGWALSFKMEFLAFQLQRIWNGDGKH